MIIPKHYKLIYKEVAKNYYLAKNLITNEICVMKVLSQYDLSVYKNLVKIKSPNICRIFAVYEQDSELLVFEELIQGSILSDYLKRDEITTKERESIFDQICDALQVIHSNNPQIIHRDLKPSNIMVTNEGIVKLIDFNAAKTYKNYQNTDTVFLGTQKYAAPEQYGFSQSDARTDIFALGKMLYEILPHKTNLDNIVKKATAIDPEARYQSVKELRYSVTRNPKHTKTYDFFSKIKVKSEAMDPLITICGIVYFGFYLLFMSKYKDKVEMIDHWSIWRHGYYDIVNTIVFLAPLDLVFNITRIWNLIPFIKKRNKIERVACAIVLFIILSNLYKLCNHYLVDILFPYV